MDYNKTFSLIVKSIIVQIVLSLALSRDWVVYQLDINNAFFHGTLTKTVYL